MDNFAIIIPQKGDVFWDAVISLVVLLSALTICLGVFVSTTLALVRVMSFWLD